MAMTVTRNRAEDLMPHPDHSSWTGDPDVPQSDEKHVSDGHSVTFPGPLMSAKMQKEELMSFIQGKCQESLLHLDQPQQQFFYFFWSVMERFCNRNGRVMMAEIGVILFNGYSLLRRKLGRVENRKNWCLPLAQLLCSKAPEEKHIEAMIEMGDSFTSKGWTNAAHICYVVAKMGLGSRPTFNLIGCDRMPGGKSATKEAIERTEVYEYVLSLTSGTAQPSFQKFKYTYACELAKSGDNAQAFAYCEIIAKAFYRFLESIQSCLIEWLIMLSQHLLHEMKEEEPAWLIILQQLLRDTRIPSSSSDESEQYSSSSQGSVDLEFDPSDHSEFDSRYTMGVMLGQGGFASVYTGVRKADGREVAIKCMAKGPYDVYITIPGETRSLPVEVALLEMLSKPPRCEKVVELLEWFETSTFIILVLERPIPCMDLYDYCKHTKVNETVARKVMEQVVWAAEQCSIRGVLHRDIKLENVLINPDTLDVKLIDLGSGDLLKDEFYTETEGTPSYWPPEYFLQDEYSGIPSTVWGLGVLLFYLMSRCFPFEDDIELIEGHVPSISGLSDACCNLIQWCLTKEPENRPTLRQILQHHWFME